MTARPVHDRTVLVLSQVYVPDPAAVGQHVADVAAELARRGHRVRVFAASRGYEDPSVKYLSREVRDSVQVRRLAFSSFGKHSVALRLLAGIAFVLQAMLRGLLVRKLGAVVVSTSPPMCSFAAVVIGAVRRVPVVYWVMDLNPDQMIALGKTAPDSLPSRAFDFLNRLILRRARDVIVLDRFMAERVNRKVDVRHKMTVSPPWAHEQYLEPVEHSANPFRARHGLDGKFVVMYSGNHGFSTPVTTVLRAAEKLRDRDDIAFLFIGGGVGKAEVERAVAEQKLANVRSLHYQPLSEIKYSLSAADLHVVTIGDAVVGIVHPCKVYGAMAVARPVLLVGPDPSHASDIVRGHEIGWDVRHGDVDGAVAAILEAARMAPGRRAEMGRRAQALVREQFNKARLCGAVCDIVEHALAGAPESSAKRQAAAASGDTPMVRVGHT
jgi:glycosyltransferase involved in cell wall biosynthesis